MRSSSGEYCATQTEAEVASRAAQWRTPTLLMWAGADRCVAPSGSAALAQTAPPALLTAKVYPGLSHEIFNEPEQAEVLGQLNQWLSRWPEATP